MRHQAPGHAGQLAALPADHRGTDWRQVLAVGDLAFDQAVGLLVLEEHHGVGIAHRRFQQPLGVLGGARDDHLETGHVGVEGLHRLRVVEPAVDPTTEGRPDHERAGPGAVRAVAHARGLADDLVEGGVDEVGELDLGDGYQAVERRAYRDADDGRLGERGVEYASLAIPGVQALGGQKDAALLADVLAENPDAVVARHLFVERLADALDQRLDGHYPGPDSEKTWR